MWHSPYTADQLLEKFSEEKTLFLSLSALITVLVTVLTIPVVMYSRFLFVFTPLVVTFSVFLLFSLAICWSLFQKSRCILEAMKMMLAVSIEVNPRKFKTKWNIYLFLLFNTCGFLIYSISCGFNALNITYRLMNTTSSHFFWYKIPAEKERAFRAGLILVAAIVFTLSAMTCSQAILLSSTMYFHLADIISNFGFKLKKTLAAQRMNQSSLSQTLVLFQKIVNLNHAVNDALSHSVSFTYGAMITPFFTGICSIRSFGFEMTEIIILDLSMFSFSIYSFFSMTLTGDRVQRKQEDPKNDMIRGLNLVLNRSEKSKEIEWYLLMSREIKSYDLHVTGGNMFVLSNSLILQVASALITYGVIIFQMD